MARQLDDDAVTSNVPAAVDRGYGLSATTVAEADAPALDVVGLTKSFGAGPVLAGLDLRIGRGQVHGLVGENGSGKSTAIRILSGYHEPDPGASVLVAGQPLNFGSPLSAYRLGLRFVHQDLGLVEASSILDNMSLTSGFPTRFGTIRPVAARRSVVEDLRRVGIEADPRQLVSELPASAKTGVAVARALHDDPSSPARVLVLDEPTATLPLNEVHLLLSIIRSVAARGVAVLYVTHRIDEIFEVADDVTVLRDGRAVSTTSTDTLTRARLINLLVGREFQEVASAAHDLPPRGSGSVLHVRDLTAGTLQALSFEAARGEIVGVAGITGSGRELVLPSIFGAVHREAGSVEFNGRLIPPSSPREAVAAGIAYLPPDRKLQGGIMGLTTRENMTLSDVRSFWRPPFLRRRLEIDEVKEWIHRLDIRPTASLELPLEALSGGNQQKVLFAKWLRCKPGLLLLDEPTQGVDIGAKAELHRRLLDAAREGATVIVTSVDVDELVALCHRVLVLRQGALVADLTGSEVSVSTVASTSLGSD